MSVHGLIVYEKPTCSTCRIALNLLRAKGQDFLDINYYKKPFTETKLRSLLKKMQVKPKDIVRTTEPLYRELGIAQKNLSDAEIIGLMILYPDLIQRPILEYGNQAILGRPPEKILPWIRSL